MKEDMRIATSRIKYLNTTYISKAKENFTIIEFNGTYNVTIKFEDGTIKKKCFMHHIKNGNVENPMKPKIFNIGFSGIGIFSNKTHSKYYSIWHHILQRCYCEKTQIKQPSYKSCTIDERWHNFQVFAEWCKINYINGFALDKDILVNGNKIYGPETCCFVPQEINNLFIKPSINSLPLGITKRGKKYYAQLCCYGKQIQLGGYYDINLAIEKYNTEKHLYVKEIAEKFKEIIPINLYNLLITYKF